MQTVAAPGRNTCRRQNAGLDQQFKTDNITLLGKFNRKYVTFSAAAGRAGDPQVRGVRVEPGRRRESRGAVRSVQRDGGRGVAAARTRRGRREEETKNHG